MEIFGISFNKKDKNKNNPSSTEFDKTVDTELEGVIDNFAATSLKDREEYNSEGIAPSIHSDSLDDVTCIPINSNKINRLRQYNVMSRFAEVNWCIDEFSNDCIHYDENKNFINCHIKDVEYLDDNKKKIINDEFENLIALFNFQENSYTYFKNYAIEGELCWENVIDLNTPEKGIRALKYIPTKYYDFTKDKKTGQILGIYFDKDQVNYDILTGILSNSYSGASNVFNAIMTMPGYTYAISMNDNKIPLYWPQITYFNSGMYNYENTIVYPILENASAPYQQLSLLQDAMVILRITRAPERLVFNIATGGLPEKKAKTMVNTFINGFKSKKVSNSKGEVRNSYDPAAMLDAYFFWKQDGVEGSSVTALNSQAQYDQIADIDYFLRRILKAFKIPYTRFKEDGMAVQRKESITYEEYSFTKYILRQQIAFANAIKKTFITHLKLRKIWDEYNLNDNLINIEFVKPSLYELYQAQQISSLKMQIYKEAVEDDAFSKKLAMKKYLGYTDEMADKNFEEKRNEMLYLAATEYFAEKIKKDGPKDVTPPIKANKSPEELAKDEETKTSAEPPPPENTEEAPPPKENKNVPPSETTAPEETPPEENTPPEEPSPENASELYTPPGENEVQTYIPPSPEITTLEIPKEVPGINLLPGVEYPEEKPKEQEKPKHTSTFREIFSRLNR